VASTQVAAAQTTTVGPLGLRSHAQVRTLARTHAVLLIGDSPAPFPLRAMARCACDISLSDERARAASGGDAPRHLKRHIARAHVPASARKCGRPCYSCGGRLRHSPDAGIPREVARGSHDARAAMGVRARLGASPCAARDWVLVRPPLLSWPNTPAVVFLAFFTRPTGGIAGQWPSESPNGRPSLRTASPSIEVRSQGRPPVTRPPRGDLGPIFSPIAYRPIVPRRRRRRSSRRRALRARRRHQQRARRLQRRNVQRVSCGVNNTLEW